MRVEKASRSLERDRGATRQGRTFVCGSRAGVGSRRHGLRYFAGLLWMLLHRPRLLLSKGLSFFRHGQVIPQYGLHFAKGEVLDRRFHKLLDDAFSLRQLADYSTDPSLESGSVRGLIEEGEAFLREAREYLARRSSQEHS